jgi:hypothetical protein
MSDVINLFFCSSYQENRNNSSEPEPVERPRTKSSHGKPPKSSGSIHRVRNDEVILIKMCEYFILRFKTSIPRLNEMCENKIMGIKNQFHLLPS